MSDTAYVRRWQRAGHKLLATFLADGVKHDLPPLMWTLATSGALTGEVSVLGTSADERREAVKRWADHVGATVNSRQTADGGEELSAFWKIPVKGETGDVGGCFRAVIFAEDQTKQDLA